MILDIQELPKYYNIPHTRTHDPHTELAHTPTRTTQHKGDTDPRVKDTMILIQSSHTLTRTTQNRGRHRS